MTPSSADTWTSRTKLWFWLAGIAAFFVFIALVHSILLPFVVGILAAYFLDPLMQKLRRWQWPRPLSAAVITITFFALAVTLCVFLVPLIFQQLDALLHELPDYLEGLQDHYSSDFSYYLSLIGVDQNAVRKGLSGFTTTFAGWMGSFATGALRSGLALLNVLSLVFLTPVISFYLLRDWDKIVVKVDDLLPRDHAPTIRTQVRAIDRTLSGFIRGQTNVCLIMASYYGITLSLAGLKFGLGVGIMTGLMLFVPFVGILTSFVLSMAITLFQFPDSAHAIIILVIYGFGMILEGSIITPRLVGGKVGLHPIWIIFGMLAGAALFGFVGILIAVPVTAVLGVLVRFALTRYLQSSLYSGK